MKISKQNIVDIGAVSAAGILAFSGVGHFRLAATLVCARAIDWWLDKKTVKPHFALSGEQGKVIDFLAARFDTLCFGDTRHTSPFFYALITDEAFQERLRGQDFKICFLELPARFEKWIGDLEAKKVSQDDFACNTLGRGTKWGSRSVDNLRGKLLAAAVARHTGQFHAADLREFNKILPFPARMVGHVINTAVQVFFPRRFPNMFGVIAALTTADLMEGGNVERQIVDDTTTVKRILKQLAPGERCSIAYGAGHFEGTAQDFGGTDMVTALINGGRHPVVVNVFDGAFWHDGVTSGYRKRISENKPCRPADVDFILEKNGRPGGIIFNNEALKSAYQVSDNFRSGRHQRSLYRSVQSRHMT